MKVNINKVRKIQSDIDIKPQRGKSSMGFHKHGVSGKCHNEKHFTGTKGSNTRRKRKALSRKQKRMQRGMHFDKYAKRCR